MALVNFPNAAQTTLSGNGGGIGIGAPSMKVAAPAAFGAAPFFVRVEHQTAGAPDGTQVEYMLVTAVAGSTFTITKGQDGTNDQSHSDGDFVTAVVTNAGLTTGLVRQILLGAPTGSAYSLSPAGGQGIVTLTPPTFAAGTLGYAQVTADQGSITTAVDLTGLTVTVTPGAGRRIRIKGQVSYQSTVASDSGILAIFADGSQVELGQRALNPTPNVPDVVGLEVVLTPTNAAHTYKLQGSRQGTGTLTMKASATTPAFILVEDIGT